MMHRLLGTPHLRIPLIPVMSSKKNRDFVNLSATACDIYPHPIIKLSRFLANPQHLLLEFAL